MLIIQFTRLTLSLFVPIDIKLMYHFVFYISLIDFIHNNEAPQDLNPQHSLKILHNDQFSGALFIYSR
ncbi:hypothetical protein CXF88_06700 [Shewanella sp. ALD9]|jgi:hypothetical protein|nr:hypothetical protein CXF88_06700 [Shewanella sp. ALD9]